MKAIVKILGLLIVLGATSSHAEVKFEVNPAYYTCTVVFPDGNVAQGNGKNDICLLFEGVEGVEIFYHTGTFIWNSEKFLCETNGGELLHVIKNIFRIDEYIVQAFGYEYYGQAGSGPGIVDGLSVRSPKAPQFEPMKIIFHSNSSGVPENLTVHLQGGRAPLYKSLQCQAI